MLQTMKFLQLPKHPIFFLYRMSPCTSSVSIFRNYSNDPKKNLFGSSQSKTKITPNPQVIQLKKPLKPTPQNTALENEAEALDVEKQDKKVRKIMRGLLMVFGVLVAGYFYLVVDIMRTTAKAKEFQKKLLEEKRKKEIETSQK